MPAPFTATINIGNNRVVGFTYDNAGNVTGDGVGNLFDYDAENRQIEHTRTGVGSTDYFYDGDGRRVKKVGSDGTTFFVYNVTGQLIAEYHSDPVPPIQGGGGTSYLTTDHLGSTRVVTNSSGGVKARYDYLPFGEEIDSGVGGRATGMGYSAADGTRQKFTQKERDVESGLDYFLARYYSSAQGRFTSVDPENVGASHDDPQSWNGYAYARNNPMLYVDPDGTTYRLYDLNGNWQDISDADADEWRKKDGVVFKKGKIFDKDGNQLGTYRLAWDDSASLNFNLFIYGREGMVARAPAMNQSIGAFAGGTAAVGAIAGAAVVVGPLAIPFIVPAVEKISVVGPTIAITLLSKAQDPKLRNFIDKLYRVTAQIGSGSTADAIRYERITGKLLSPSGHSIKGQEIINGLQKLINSGKLNSTDRAIAQQLVNDLKDALK